MRRASLTLALSLLACGAPERAAAPPPPRPITLTVIGTNDLHGHVRALPIFAGYLAILRELRADDGAVVLLDGGDLFQGTLESNLLEGAPVIEAYGLLGYDAATIGNHEFDYGPVGERVTPGSPDDDPRGALRARARQAGFPLLSANLHHASGEPLGWENVAPSVLLERGGVRVGVIGVTTEDTLTTTIAANVRDLAVEPLAQAIAREADALRARGAEVVLVAAHAGGRCEAFEDARDLSSCRPDEEIFRVARALPERAVDAVVAGHTHAGVAHLVHGIPIIESFSYGRAFGRVDLVVEPSRGVVDVIVHPPRELCEEGSADAGDCAPGAYEGRAVSPDARVAAALTPALENARALRERLLGVVLEGDFGASYGAESPLGNLFTDLMRAARPGADVAVTNGGGLRADLPAGALTYGALYEASPFDNQFAVVRLRAAELAAILAANLAGRGGFLSIGGLRAEARCEGGALRVSLRDEHGRAIDEARELIVVTTDFLATSGALGVPAERVTIEEGRFVREAMAGVLAERGGRLSPAQLHTPERARVRYEGERPVTCP